MLKQHWLTTRHDAGAVDVFDPGGRSINTVDWSKICDWICGSAEARAATGANFSAVHVDCLCLGLWLFGHLGSLCVVVRLETSAYSATASAHLRAHCLWLIIVQACIWQVHHNDHSD